MFIGSALAGFMVIYYIRLFRIDALIASGFVSDTESAVIIAGTAMASYAIFNSLGRIIWGTVSDKISRKRSLFLMFLIQGLMMLTFMKIGWTKTGLIIGDSLIEFNFGGDFALFPAITSDSFSLKNLGPNYG